MFKNLREKIRINFPWLISFEIKRNHFKDKSPRLYGFLKYSGHALALLITCFLGFYFAVLWGAFGHIPTTAELSQIRNNIASEVYSQDGVLLGTYFTQNRTNVIYNDIPDNVIHALIATEDARFYEHNGVDVKSLMRVLVKSLLMGNKSAGGGSTISQQLAKNLFPRKSYSFLSMPVNKLREAIIAGRLESIHSKGEIIKLYINTVSFGEDTYGIETAAKRFFNTAVDSLSIEEAAVLIGALKNPTIFNPRTRPENALKRRNAVLSQMGKYGYISGNEADSLKDLDLLLRYQKHGKSRGPAPYLREYLRLKVEKWASLQKKPDGSSYNIYTDGLIIYTTIHSKMQQYAEESTKEHLSKLQLDFYRHWNGKKPWGNSHDVITRAMMRTERYKSLKAGKKSKKEVENAFNIERNMKVFSWDGEGEKKMSPMDSLEYYQQFLHSGFLAMEPGSGKILAWVGGINHQYFPYDHVVSNRQVGSTFKPFVYAAALKHGVSPCEYISNKRKVFRKYENWSPRNADGNYKGSYTMEGGLMNSVNVISANLIMETGVPKVVEMARDMGIKTEIPEVPSLALGVADLSLYEMVQAYSTFPNRGYSVKPTLITRIEDRNGEVIEDFSRDPVITKVFSPEIGDMMIKMMRSVVDSGTASRLRRKYRLTGEIGGKTGTTQSHADGWFMGFTPNLVAGAWVGAEDPRVHFSSIALGQGANTALPIWGIFMLKLSSDEQLKEYAIGKFPLPSREISKLMNCPPYKNEKLINKLLKIFKRKKRSDESNGTEQKKDKSMRKKIKNLFRKKNR